MYDISRRIVSDHRLSQDYTVDPSGLHGNGVLEFANDYRLDVSKWKDDRKNDRARCTGQWVTVLHRGEPRLIIVATRTIPPGGELLIDYGHTYWQATAAETAAAKLKPSNLS